MAMKKLLIMLALSLMICGCSKDDGVADLPEPAPPAPWGDRCDWAFNLKCRLEFYKEDGTEKIIDSSIADQLTLKIEGCCGECNIWDCKNMDLDIYRENNIYATLGWFNAAHQDHADNVHYTLTLKSHQLFGIRDDKVIHIIFEKDEDLYNLYFPVKKVKAVYSDDINVYSDKQMVVDEYLEQEFPSMTNKIVLPIRITLANEEWS